MTDSRSLAREWFEKTAIPGWAGKTAQDLVLDGKADRVLEYLEASRSGVYG
nr:antitoxin Xre/MbcA/ParS toxin-binding domain-containing protein [Mesorhizobium sp.]